MSNRPREGRTLESAEIHRTRQLRRASDRLAAVLQSLDLEDETRLADEVIEAIRATDRAYELQTGDERSGRGTDEFVFPSARADGGSVRDQENERMW